MSGFFSRDDYSDDLPALNQVYSGAAPGYLFGDWAKLRGN
jgi:hypothetical protein